MREVLLDKEDVREAQVRWVGNQPTVPPFISAEDGVEVAIIVLRGIMRTIDAQHILCNGVVN